MCIVEPWDNPASDRVDHAGARPNQGRDIALLANSGDAPVRRSERASLWPGRISSENASVSQDEIGRIRRGLDRRRRCS